MAQDDDDLSSYWEDLPQPHPRVAPVPGHLWMGLCQGDIELSVEGYIRQKVSPQFTAGDCIIFRSSFEVRFPASSFVTRICLWAAEKGGERIYWKDIERVNLSSVLKTITFQLNIQDTPVSQPVSFRRLLTTMGLL